MTNKKPHSYVTKDVVWPKKKESSDSIYVSKDGYWIEKDEKVFVLKFVDPGHGGGLVERVVDSSVFEYAKKNEPNLNDLQNWMLKKKMKSKDSRN